jgi:hypothetical protein
MWQACEKLRGRVPLEVNLPESADTVTCSWRGWRTMVLAIWCKSHLFALPDWACALVEAAVQTGLSDEQFELFGDSIGTALRLATRYPDRAAAGKLNEDFQTLSSLISEVREQNESAYATLKAKSHGPHSFPTTADFCAVWKNWRREIARIIYANLADPGSLGSPSGGGPASQAEEAEEGEP